MARLNSPLNSDEVQIPRPQMSNSVVWNTDQIVRLSVLAQPSTGRHSLTRIYETYIRLTGMHALQPLNIVDFVRRIETCGMERVMDTIRCNLVIDRELIEAAERIVRVPVKPVINISASIPIKHFEKIRRASVLALYAFASTNAATFRLQHSLVERFGFPRRRFERDRQELIATGLLQKSYLKIDPSGAGAHGVVLFERCDLFCRGLSAEEIGVWLWLAAFPLAPASEIAGRFGWSLPQTLRRLRRLEARDVVACVFKHPLGGQWQICLGSTLQRVGPEQVAAMASSSAIAQARQSHRSEAQLEQDKKRMIAAAGGRRAGSVFDDVLWAPKIFKSFQSDVYSGRYTIEEFEAEVIAYANDLMAIKKVRSWKFFRLRIDARRRGESPQLQTEQVVDVPVGSIERPAGVLYLPCGLIVPLTDDDLAAFAQYGGVSAAQAVVELNPPPRSLTQTGIVVWVVDQLQRVNGGSV